MLSRGQKILQLLKNRKDREPAAQVICAKDIDQLCSVESGVNLQKVTSQSEMATNKNNSELDGSEDIRTFATLNPVSFEDNLVDNQKPSTSGRDSSIGIFIQTDDDEHIGESSGDEFRPNMSEESSSSCNEIDEEIAQSQNISCHAITSSTTRRESRNRPANMDQILDTEHDMAYNNIVEGVVPKKKMKVFPVKEKMSKKRVRDESKWKKRKQALAREKGENYVSNNGKKKEAKNTVSMDLCGEKCRLKCNEKFSLEERKRVLTDFYNLDVNAKNALLFRCIRSLSVRRKRKNAKAHKSHSYKYIITLNNEEKVVCKTAFCKLHQIGRGKIEVIKQKLSSGGSAPS